VPERCLMLVSALANIRPIRNASRTRGITVPDLEIEVAIARGPCENLLGCE